MKNRTSVIVWDPFVRVFHWSLALVFLLNYLITESGDDVHQWLGYAAGGLICARLVWGFRNTGAARWSRFWPTGTRLKDHWRALRAGQPHRELTHSAFGALVMIAMMSGVFLLGLSGFAMEEIDYFWGDDRMEAIHIWLSDGVALLAGLHVCAAIIQSVWLKENLPLSMITGRRRAPQDSGDSESR